MVYQVIGVKKLHKVYIYMEKKAFILRLLLAVRQINSGIKTHVFFHEKKPNVMYHGIWALLAFLLNNALCSLQETVVWNLATGNRSFLKGMIWCIRIFILFQFTILL